MKKVLLITLSFAVMLLAACSSGSQEQVDKEVKYYTDFTETLEKALEDDELDEKEIEKLIQIENDYNEWRFSNLEKSLKYAEKKELEQAQDDYWDAMDDLYDLDEDAEDFWDAYDEAEEEWDEKFEDLYDDFD